MHKKRPGSRASTAKIYLYHSTKIAKARPHSVERQTDSSVQKQWFMDYHNNTPAFSKLTSPFLLLKQRY